MNGMFNSTIILVPTPLGLEEGPKGQISLNFNYKVSSKDFFNQTLCVSSQTKDIKHIRWDFHPVTWVMPQGWDLGVLGCQNLNFLNMVMWHIKLKGMIFRPGYTEKFYPMIKLVTLGLGQKVKYN